MGICDLPPVCKWLIAQYIGCVAPLDPILYGSEGHINRMILSDDYEQLSEYVNTANVNRTMQDCAKYGSVNCLKLMLQSNNVDVEVHDELLALAAGNNHLECLQFLLKFKHKSTSGALLAAVHSGHSQCLKLLIDGFYVPEHPDATHIAAENGHAECLDMLLKKNFPRKMQTPNVAAAHGHLECLTVIIKHKYYMSEETTYWAAKNGHAPCLELLLAANYPLHKKALISAVKNEHYDCMKLLIDRYVPDAELVFWASINESSDCLKLLLSRNYPQHRKATIRALKFNRSENLQLLIAAGYEPIS